MELSRIMKESKNRVDAREKIVKEVITLFPGRGVVALWENKVREHEVWWGDVYIKVLSTSLLVSSGVEIKVVKEGERATAVEETYRLIHLDLNPLYTSEYILPCLLGSERPRIAIEPERGAWWEEVRDLTKVRVRVPHQNPIKVLASPYSPSGYYEAEFKTYQTKPPEVEERPLWRAVERLVSKGKMWEPDISKPEKREEIEDIGVNGEEVRKFIGDLLKAKGEKYDPKVKHFLILPRHIVYKNDKGETLVVEGSFLSNPRDQKWAFGSVGYWTEHLAEWLRPWGRGEDTAREKGERHNLNRIKVMRIRNETPPGWVHATVTKVSRWTEEWSLVLIMDEIFSGKGKGHEQGETK